LRPIGTSAPRARPRSRSGRRAALRRVAYRPFALLGAAATSGAMFALAAVASESSTGPIKLLWTVVGMSMLAVAMNLLVLLPVVIPSLLPQWFHARRVLLRHPWEQARATYAGGATYEDEAFVHLHRDQSPRSEPYRLLWRLPWQHHHLQRPGPVIPGDEREDQNWCRDSRRLCALDLVRRDDRSHGSCAMSDGELVQPSL
jgi:hypothetical protein